MRLDRELSGQDGPVVMRFRYEQRTQVNGFIATMDAALVGGSIDLDNDRAIARTCRLELDQSGLPSTFNFLTSYIAVFAEVLANGAFERIQVGLFRLTDPTETTDPSNNDLVAFTGSDVSYLLVKPKTQVTYEIAAGANYITEIRTILTAQGVNHALPASVDTTPIGFTWAPGTTWSKIVNELLIGINHFEIFADPEGTMRSRERIRPSGQEPGVHYRTDAEPRMIIPPFKPRESSATIPNVLLGFTTDPNRSPIASSVQNIDPESRFGSATNPIRYAELANDRVVDVDTMVAFTEYELRLATGEGRTGELRTMLDPRRTSNETYDLTIETDELQTRWRVRGWSLPLRPGGVMRHRLQEALDLTFGVTL